MKILYHHRTVGRGAEGHHISSVVNAFQELGHTVSILSPPGVDPLTDKEKSPVDKTEKKESGISRIWQIVSRKSPQLFFEFLEFLYNFRALFKLFQAPRPNMIYERYAFFLWAGALYCSMRNIPFFLEVNEISGLKRAREQKLVTLTNWIEKWIFNKADTLFVVSSKLKEEIVQRGIEPDKIIVTPNAVLLSDFDLKAEQNTVRNKYNLTEKLIIGFVGWFDHWDRLDKLIDIFADLAKEENRLHLLLVGDGPIRKDLEDKIEHYQIRDKVTLTGGIPRNEVKKYIEAMDICLIPHTNVFGSPIILFEYMAMKKAILAPDLPPILDVIEDGVNGIIFKTGKSDSLTSAIRSLLVDSKRRITLGQTAYNILRENFTWQANARRILTCYENLASRKE